MLPFYRLVSLRLSRLAQLAEQRSTMTKVNSENGGIEAVTWVSTIGRMFRGDSRKETLKYIRETFDLIDNLFQFLGFLDDDEMRRNLATEIAAALEGVRALMNTYRADPTYVAEVAIEVRRAEMSRANDMAKLQTKVAPALGSEP